MKMIVKLFSYYCLLLSILCLIACRTSTNSEPQINDSQQTPNPSADNQFTSQVYNDQTVTIKGKINLPKEQIENKPVTIHLRDLIQGEQLSYAARTDKNGRFEITIPKYHPQDIELIIDEEEIPIIVFPGDDIYVEFDFPESNKPIQFSGDHADINQDLHRFLADYDQFLISFGDPNEKRETSTPDEYKAYIFKLEKESLAYLNRYHEKQHLHPTAMTWLQHYITYKNINLLFRAYAINSEKYNLSDDFWDFIDQYFSKDDSPTLCSDYSYFIDSYYIYLSNVEKMLAGVMPLYGNDWTAFYQKSIDRISQRTSGFEKELLIANNYSRFMKDDLEAFDSLQEDYKNKIQGKWIHEQIAKNKESLKAGVQNRSKVKGIEIFDFREDTSDMDIIGELLFKYKNKVIYIDNWATWCGPCIAEMPHSKALQKKYAGKDVVFVYLCNADNYENDRAMATIMKHELPGKHYLMNFKQSYKVQFEFSSRGLPRYMVIDKKGKIINNHAPRPSSNEILGAIDSLLTL